ncbi:MFS family permease [Nocardiopsis arvandica]|uniref:MFS family permease n=1 Tax=Nocardiopsis sinuspersici TaxID=501010 RepID=A0A7Y9XIE4_9ACTN|nr:MFS transporter [Nocardiopsis sinuspersici]NYH55165.1 MFS family permease [Nocardiopsis sinuspersici]
MTTSPSRAAHARALRLTRPLYAYAALGEFVLLYPLYAVLFDQSGLSVAQISSLFAVWSLTSVAVSVPAGAWADVVPRRYLLAAAPLLSAAGFSLWLLWPGYWAFAAGFVLWGAGGALASGALEALVYTELGHRGATERYARVMGVVRALDVAAVGAATLLAIPVMAHGGYTAIGAGSVTACVLCSLAALALPEHRAGAAAADHADGSGEGEPRGYRAALREGLAQARSSRRVRGAITLVVVVSSFWMMLEEYVPLLAAESGVPTDTVPVVVLVVWVCVTAGGLLAGPVSRLPVGALALLLGLAAPAVAAGALLPGPPGWVLLGAGFGVCQAAGVVADARLQDRITGTSRATVTSVAALGTDALTTASYPLYAGVFTLTGHSAAFALFAAPYLVAALVLGRSRPRRTASGGR